MFCWRRNRRIHWSNKNLNRGLDSYPWLKRNEAYTRISDLLLLALPAAISRCIPPFLLCKSELFRHKARELVLLAIWVVTCEMVLWAQICFDETLSTYLLLWFVTRSIQHSVGYLRKWEGKGQKITVQIKAESIQMDGRSMQEQQTK